MTYSPRLSLLAFLLFALVGVTACGRTGTELDGYGGAGGAPITSSNGGAGGAPQKCGNGVCDPGESCASCAPDCGICAG